MGFIDSYKRLEKLLSEVYGDNHGISAYIDEMVKTSDGSYYVSAWNEDLKQLKHFRWVRNQIVHEPNCTEENMCTLEDAQWINNFYSCVMTANDPLAKYRKFKQRTKTNAINVETVYTEPQYVKSSGKVAGWFVFLAGAVFGAMITYYVLNFIKF